MKYAVTTAPITEPIMAVEAKIHLRTVTGDTSEDSAIINPLITAAREYCENVTGRALAIQTIKAYPEAWGLWRLPRPPVSTITSIKYYDADSTEYTLSPAKYQFDAVEGLLSILEKPATALRDLNPIEIEYIVGSANCPMAVRQAMLLLIGHWYQNREAIGAVGEGIELGVKCLLNQYKVWWY